MLNAPGGSPASIASSAMRMAVNGVSSAGLSTTVFPHASAGATFHAASEIGKVPRHDRADDADRLAERVVEERPVHGDRLPVNFVRPPAVVLVRAQP